MIFKNLLKFFSYSEIVIKLKTSEKHESDKEVIFSELERLLTDVDYIKRTIYSNIEKLCETQDLLLLLKSNDIDEIRDFLFDICLEDSSDENEDLQEVSLSSEEGEKER